MSGCRAQNHDLNPNLETWLAKNSIYLKIKNIMFPKNSITLLSLTYVSYVTE